MTPAQSEYQFQSMLRNLKTEAMEACARAYAPYSKFTVGAAVLTESGEIFTGSNVENASYGLTMCAERVAVFAAVSAGHRKIVGLVLYTPTKSPTAPCGACRQVIREFGQPYMPIVSFCEDSALDGTRWTLGELLPDSFGPENLVTSG